MNAAHTGACFIDANIIFYIHDIRGVDGFQTIIEQVYTQVFIHKEVYRELSSGGKQFVDQKLERSTWFTFEESSLTGTQLAEYRQFISRISYVLNEVDRERGKAGSPGLGEIYSLAAATVLNASFICSNDYSIQSVIDQVPLDLYPDGNDELEPYRLIQHRFLDLCYRVVEKSIMNRAAVYKGYKIALRSTKLDNPEEYHRLLTAFHTLIPADL